MDTKPISTAAAFGRLYWMLVGPALLFVLFFQIAQNRVGRVTAEDLLFLVALGGMVVARRLEFGGGDPRTCTDEPATLAHLRRYMLLAPTIGLMFGVAAKLFGIWGRS